MIVSGKEGAQAVDAEFIAKNESLFKFVKPKKIKKQRK